MDIGQILVGIADMAERERVTREAEQIKSPPAPPNFSKTQRVLLSMFRENTGASILDSGSAYGRHWQRNLLEDFSKRERCKVNFSTWESHDKGTQLSVEVTIDAFTWLSEKCEYDRRMTKHLRHYASLPENEDESWLAIMEGFPEWLAKRWEDREITGFQGEGDPWVINTYNEECLLSQTLQFVYFEVDGDPYVLLQIHGGCDVRGGYTAPQAFRVDEYFLDYKRADMAPDWNEIKALREKLTAAVKQEPSLFPGEDAAHLAEIAGLGEDINWSTDDGYSWYYQGSCGLDYDAKQLDKMPCKEVDSRAQWERGVVCVLPDGNALCPFTGCTLRVGWW